jgi:hypothetical protein
MAEEQQGKDMVDAAKAAGIKHFVWTTLDHSEWQTPHFETKARVNDYLIASGVPRTSCVANLSSASPRLTFLCQIVHCVLCREPQESFLHREAQ